MPLGLGVGGAPEEERGGRVESLTCVKCPSPGTVRVVGQAYCQPCFLALVSHKFRGLLGRRRVFERPGEAVGVGLDGGPAATALLRLLTEGLSAHPKRGITVRPTLLTLFSHQRPDRLRDAVQSMRAAVAEHDLPWHFLHLSAVFLTDEQRRAALDSDDLPSEEELARLSDLLSSVRSETSRWELRRRLKWWLLSEVGRALGLERVIVGTTGSSLAVRSLTDVVLGRGAQIGAEAGLLEKRGPVTFVRPLRDVSDKEIALFNHFRGLVPAVLEEREGRGTVGGASAAFVGGLVASGFPGTVTTLTSTAVKVVPPPLSDPDTAQPCRLCLVPAAQRLCFPCANLIDEVSNPSLLPDFLRVE